MPRLSLLEQGQINNLKRIPMHTSGTCVAEASKKSVIGVLCLGV